MNFFPGQRVITTHGTVRVIAFIEGEKVFAFSPRGGIERVIPKTEAWGGEHDVDVRNAA